METRECFITHYQLHVDNPTDEPLPVGAADGYTRVVGPRPTAVVADHGMGSQQNETALASMGITQAAVRARGKPSRGRRPFERRRAFPQLVRWCSGVEGRIAHLKHAFQLGRSLYRGKERHRTWAGDGIFAHSLTRAARRILAQAPARA